jgi:oxygen-dependent protoporphyrinogen oxidase
VDGRPRPLSLRDGLGRLPAALAAASGAHVRTGTTVRVVTRTAPGRWRLELGPVPHPQVLDVDAVVLALPPLAAARLLRPLVPAAATLLDTVATASVATVTLAYRRKDVAAGSLVGSGHVVPVEAGTPVRAVSYASQRWTWLARALPDLELLRVSVGRVGDEQVLQREDADLVTLAARHLVDTLGVAAKPAAGAVFRWGGALPLYAVGHVSRVERVRSVVASQPGLVLAGTGLDGTGVHACVAAAQRAAEQVLASAAQPQRLP